MADEQGVLIVAEHGGGSLSSVSAELSAIGRKLADDLSEPLVALIMGHNVSELATRLGELGADRVLLVDDEKLDTYHPELARAAAEQAVAQVNPSMVLFGQTVNGRDLAPRLAFRLGTGLVTDCTDLRIDPETRSLVMVKPVYGGLSHGRVLHRRSATAGSHCATTRVCGGRAAGGPERRHPGTERGSERHHRAHQDR